jgi:hypothetical protein
MNLEKRFSNKLIINFNNKLKSIFFNEELIIIVTKEDKVYEFEKFWSHIFDL